METQTSIFGNLDTAYNALERGCNAVEKKLAEGRERMRLEDVKRAKKYIKSIEVKLRCTKVVLKEFENFAS